MRNKDHWEHVYATQPTQGASWFQPHAERSLALIRGTGVPPDTPIIDVGGGASILVDDLLSAGYRSLSVLDLSAAALAVARERLGTRADAVRWIEADATTAALPRHAFAIWHDRAAFHFLTGKQQRRAYIDTLMHAVRPGGHAIIATFAEDGPTRCSGLPVVRYSAEALQAELGEDFARVAHAKEDHRTPFGTIQRFSYCLFRVGED